MELLVEQAPLERIPVKEKVRPWWKKADVEYLINCLRSEDRMEIAAALVELAERAERSENLREILRKTQLPKLEYRKPSNRKGYWARIPYTRYHPSQGELKARIEFSKIAYDLFGTMGTVERPDGTRIARLNYLQGEIMRGMKIVSDEEKEQRQKQKAIERILLVP